MKIGLLRDSRATHEKAEKVELQRRHAEALRKMKESEVVFPAATSTVRSDIPVAPPISEAVKESAKEVAKDAAKKVVAKPHIRPLSESKAIDAGANFISEAFLFAVAAGLVFAEAMRNRKKELNRRDIVAERLDLLEDRNRQDEQRLEELERRDRENQERLYSLEEEVWKLRGGKGKWPGHKNKIEYKTWEPKPLWEPKEKSEGGLMDWVWRFGQKTEAPTDAEKAVIVLENKQVTK